MLIIALIISFITFAPAFADNCDFFEPKIFEQKQHVPFSDTCIYSDSSLFTLHIPETYKAMDKKIITLSYRDMRKQNIVFHLRSRLPENYPRFSVSTTEDPDFKKILISEYADDFLKGYNAQVKKTLSKIKAVSNGLELVSVNDIEGYAIFKGKTLYQDLGEVETYITQILGGNTAVNITFYSNPKETSQFISDYFTLINSIKRSSEFEYDHKLREEIVRQEEIARRKELERIEKEREVQTLLMRAFASLFWGIIILFITNKKKKISSEKSEEKP